MRRSTSRDHVVDALTFRVRSTPPRHERGEPHVVLVHGIGTSHRYLARIHSLLAETSAVHSVDLPGFGGVQRPARAASVPEMSEALGTVLSRICAGRAIVVGHSMGTQWVTELAVLRPDLVRAVVLIGPVADARHRSAWAQLRALARDVTRESLSANAIVLADYVRCGPVWFARQLRWMLAYPHERRIPEVGAPGLVLRGGRDPIAGLDWCRRLRDLAGDGMLAVVPGHRHNAQHTNPGAVAAAITAFAARTS